MSELRLSTFIFKRVFSRLSFCFMDPLRDYLMYYLVWLRVGRILGWVEFGSEGGRSGALVWCLVCYACKAEGFG